MFPRRLMTCTIVLLLLAAIPSVGAQAQTDERCFPETSFCIAGRIREFWEQNGGLSVFGFPITEQREEAVEGRPFQVQWFERTRLELHPENARPYDVLLGRLGARRLEQQNRDWFAFPKSEAQRGCRFFSETGHNVCGDILKAWRANGLEFDGRRGKSEAENLALFGLPLSDPQEEDTPNGHFTVQWFERARFELHPENVPPYDVLLGLLGGEVYRFVPPAPAPTMTTQFKSTSGRTVIAYYDYQSPTCGTGANCSFRGPIKVPPGFDQVEVFLSGFTLETQSMVDKVAHAAAQVQKFRYDIATGELEVGVSGQLSTGSGQPYAYHVTFVVILTDATAAKFTRAGNGCAGIAQCNIVKSFPGAVPPGMHYIGLGTRIFDVGSNSGPLLVNALSAHIDSLSVTPPDVALNYLCALRDASMANRMFCEWDASIIAFDPAEMDRNNSTIFPQTTIIGTSVSVAQRFSNQVQTPSGAPITGFFDAFEGITFLYPAGQEYAIWLVESSAANFRISGAPPNTAITDYGILLGTIFSDRINTQTYGFQSSRALGLLR